MRAHVNATMRGKLLAAYVDEASPARPPSAQNQPSGESDKATLIGSYVDRATRPPWALPLREFLVQTLDNKTISVRGHSIEAGPDASRQVVIFTLRRTICVAMFDGTKILGIYEAPRLSRAPTQPSAPSEVAVPALAQEH